MPFPFLILALVAVAFIGMILLMPKPKVENARPETLDKLNFPTAAEGSPVPLVLGSVRHRGPNTLYYGGFRSVAIKKKVKTGLFSSKNVVTGYKYYITLDLGLCLGPGVVLKRIWFDKDEVWSGSVGPDEATISIDKPSLWGGEEKGGGFVGTLRFYGGQITQSVNAAVAALVAPNEYPAYGSQCHIVLEDCYIGTAAQLRAMSFELARYTNALGLSAGQHIIGEDMNPAEMLYQIQTLEWGGLDVDPNDIDLPSFVAAGGTLFTEGNGMSLIISSPNAGGDAINEVLRQADGVMYQDPVTGKIIAELIRHDYVLEDLMVLDKSNVTACRAFSRTSWDDTINQVRITYTNRDNKFEKGTAIVQDLANINSQGRIRSVNFSYPGCTEGVLANKLASREMSQTSVPVFSASLEVNREAAGLRPGQVFIWSWDEFNLEQVVMRIQKFNLGELIDGRIVIDCVQDKFALDQTIFSPPEPTLHEPADRSAVPIVDDVVAEVPYWIMQQQDFAPVGSVPANKTFVMALARNPSPTYQQGYTATIEQGATKAVAVDHDSYSSTAKLHTAFNRLAGFSTGVTSIVIDSPLDDSSWLAGASTAETQSGSNMFLLGTEIMSFESFVDHGDGTWTLNNVRRGLLDSRAVDHSIGETLYMLSANPISDEVWAGSTALSGHFQSYTDKDETPYADADVKNLVPNRRYERPLPPDYLTVEGSRTPAAIFTPGPFTIDWRPRTRLSAIVRGESDAADAEEAGVTYTLRVYLDGVLQPALTQAGLAVTTAELTFADDTAGNAVIEVSSVRGGLESYTAGWIEVRLDVHVFTALPVVTPVPAISSCSISGTHHLTALLVTTSAPAISAASLAATHVLTSLGVATSAPSISSTTAGLTGPADPMFDLTKLVLNFNGAGSSAWTDLSDSPVTFGVDIGAPTTSGGYLVVGGSDRISSPGGAVKWNPNLSTQGQGSTSGDWCLEASVIHNNADAGANVGYIQWGDGGGGVFCCAIYHNSSGGYSVVMRGAVTGSYNLTTANTYPITPGHETRLTLEKVGNMVRFSVDGALAAKTFMNERMLTNSGAFVIGGCTIGGVGNLNGKVGPVRMTFGGRYNSAAFTPDVGPFPTSLDPLAYNERDQIGWITANNANGWSGNNNTKSMIQWVVPFPGRWISKIRARVGTGGVGEKVTPVLYSAYSDAANVFKTGQEYTLGHAIASTYEDVEMFWNADHSASYFPPGTYGLSIISSGTTWNYSANNVTPANSTRWNADTYSDGPAEPFGAGTASASSVNIFTPVSTNQPAPVTGFTALRLRCLNNGGSHRVTVGELDFMLGGSEISKSGTTAFEGGAGAVNGPAANAFDDNVATQFSRVTTGGHCYVGLRGYATPVLPDAVRITSNTDGLSASEAPQDFVIEGSNDTTDGTDGTWTIISPRLSKTDWTSVQQTITFPTYFTPTIAGSAYVGLTLTVSYVAGPWGNPSYQWKADGVAISGATATTYVPVSGDIGKVITCTVTLTTTAGATSATTPATGAVGATPPWRYFFLEFLTTGNNFLGCSTIKLPDAGGVDRALSSGGAVATAVVYTVNGGFPVTNCNDGNDTSFTTSSSASAGAGKGIQIDTGGNYSVDRLGYRSRSDSFGATEGLRTGNIYAKVNAGDSWTLLRAIDATADTFQDNEYREFMFTAVDPATVNPASLFTGSIEGVWYDPSDLSTMWKDTAGTVPVTADGDAVARIDDKSGNGHHATQATAGSRPLYKTAGGKRWLEFDGVDDYLDATTANMAQPNDVAFGARLNNFTNTQAFFDGITARHSITKATNANGNVDMIVSGSSGSLNTLDVANGEYVIVGKFNGASSALRKNKGLVTATGNPGAGNFNGVRLGASSTATNPFNGRLYGFFARDTALSISEQDQIEAFMANKAGATLP